MTEIEIKRKLVESVQKLVRANSGNLQLVEYAKTVDLLGKLLGVWTGEKVHLSITADGKSEGVFASKDAS